MEEEMTIGPLPANGETKLLNEAGEPMAMKIIGKYVYFQINETEWVKYAKVLIEPDFRHGVDI